jgi:hypothetical protein
MAGRSLSPIVIEAEIERIRSLGLEALRSEWRTMYGASPPAGLTKDIMARIMAYRLQEQALGGPDRAVIRTLERVARGEKPGTEPPRRLKAGTVLIREYQGQRHTVTVVPDGFVWQGSTYTSLSTIAKAITGTAWSGPRFFGLRSGADREGLPLRFEARVHPALRHVRARNRPLGRCSAAPRLGARRSHAEAVQAATPLRDLHAQVDRA